MGQWFLGAFPGGSSWSEHLGPCRLRFDSLVTVPTSVGLWPINLHRLYIHFVSRKCFNSQNSNVESKSGEWWGSMSKEEGPLSWAQKGGQELKQRGQGRCALLWDLALIHSIGWLPGLPGVSPSPQFHWLWLFLPTKNRSLHFRTSK